MVACARWLGLVVRPGLVVKLPGVGVVQVTGLQVWLSAPWVALALLPVGQREGLDPALHLDGPGARSELLVGW